ncbi:hypothetical protein [Novipirellula caenicola]|uniref:hypothetical protein n=1 Tax=Novipirellula caenicola TaxID=1536901 RepID=UPI0031EA2F89
MPSIFLPTCCTALGGCRGIVSRVIRSVTSQVSALAREYGKNMSGKKMRLYTMGWHF